MFIIFINCAFLFFPLAYLIKASRKKTFNFFSPFFFPFIPFSIYYLLPASFPIFLGSYDIELHHYLYVTGIIFFIIGVSISMKISPHPKNKQNEIGFIDRKKIPFFLIQLTGISLLLFYGLWSGVTFGILTGSDIEELRRTAEVGKGFIKEPGIYFASLSALFLAGFSIKFQKKSLFDKKSVLNVFLICVLIFLTVAHKTAALLPFLVLLGLYNKYKRISFVKTILIFLTFIFLIGFTNVIRSGFAKEALLSDLIKRTVMIFYTYEANYVSIVKHVERGDIEKQNGREYVQSAMLLVPRFIYPEKPLSFDYFLKDKLNRSFAGGGLPPTPVGSLFLNFGISGVLIGMLLIGFFYNYLFTFYKFGTYSTSVISLYFMYFVLTPSVFFGNLIVFTCFIIFIIIFSKILYIGALFHRNKRLYIHS